jgi:hypothetical protein
VVKRDFIERSRLNGLGIMPAGNFRRRDRCSGRGQKCGRMQRLANMANRVLPAAVLVQEAATHCEIEQREADQHCAVTAQWVLIRNAKLFEKRTSHVFYKTTSTLPRLDSGNQRSVAFPATPVVQHS